MFYCDMCGSKSEKTFVAEVEGVRMNLCQECCKFGKVIAELGAGKQKKADREVTYTAVPQFGSIVRDVRVKLDLSPKEFARQIGEKESVIKRLEAEEIEPSMKLSDKFHDRFGVKLIEAYGGPSQQMKKTDSRELTLGDVVRVKEK